jgi:hypothetical protein
MVCFCHNTMARLQLALPQLSVSADLDLDIAFAADLRLIASWMASFGLPAAPWEPDEAWLDLQLPSLSLSASAMATISAFAQLRADVLAQFGIDLLIPGQAAGFIRLAATLNARLEAMLSADLSLGLSLGVNANAWIQLSATLTAVAQVEAALSLGLFPAPPSGPPLALWRPFLIRLRVLLPLIAASIQLGLDLRADISLQLSAMLRVMLRIQLPSLSLPALQLSASLTAALSAVAQLRLALNIDPLTIGLPAVHAMVAARVGVTARLVQSSLGISLSALLALLLRLPRLEFSASLMATPATVNMAMSINAQALAAIDWQVPLAASLPVLSIGLPTIALTAQLSAALDLSASLSPCGATCDAASLLRGSVAV